MLSTCPILPYAEKLLFKMNKVLLLKIETRELLPLSLFIVSEHCSSHCASAVTFPRVGTTGKTVLYMYYTMEKLLIFQLAEF